MAIIGCTSSGWLLDDEQFLTEAYINVKSRTEEDPLSYSVHVDAFGIYIPFYRNEQMIKTCPKTNSSRDGEGSFVLNQNNCDDASYSSTGDRKKSKKRKQRLQVDEISNVGIKNFLIYHHEISHTLEKGLSSLVKLGHSSLFFTDSVCRHALHVPPVVDVCSVTNCENSMPALTKCQVHQQSDFKEVCNNEAAKRFSVLFCEKSVNFLELCQCLLYLPPLTFQDSFSYRVKELCGRLVHNPTKLALQVGDFLIPAQSRFFMSLLEDFDRFLGAVGSEKFDVIVMDPPWPNKSVKRMKTYEMLSTDDLLTIPLTTLTADTCAVFVWVTNKAAQRAFVLERLFPAAGVTYLTTWHWVKVTRRGVPVCPLDSPHKKPCEHIIIGVKSSEESSSVIDILKQHADKVLVSVPCSVHSRKPPLCDIISKVLPDLIRPLELFARCVSPGWTCWGGEVLMFQHTNFYRQNDKKMN